MMTVTVAGFASGSVMFQNFCQALAPSIWRPRSTRCGIETMPAM